MLKNWVKIKQKESRDMYFGRDPRDNVSVRIKVLDMLS